MKGLGVRAAWAELLSAQDWGISATRCFVVLWQHANQANCVGFQAHGESARRTLLGQKLRP